jgi:hypothetical protein
VQAVTARFLYFSLAEVLRLSLPQPCPAALGLPDLPSLPQRALPAMVRSIFAMLLPLAFAEKYGKAPFFGRTLASVRLKKLSASVFSAIS